jgi:Zn-dependent protease with chaperone function
MTNDRWDALVRELDVKARKDPRRYRRSVALWALGGYAVLVGALLLAVAAVVGLGLAALAGGGALLVKLALPALFVALMFARSLSVKLPPPEGIELSAADAPLLFETIERLRERVGAPKLHHVLLDGDLNASIVQLPRLGPLGWQRNYLVVGLPFMQAMSPEEFSAVIAHELGHIGGKHGSFSAWIYRLRSSWERLMDELDRGGHVGSGLLRSFFHWYLPRFTAHSFALVRAHEYEADRASADAAGARNACFALARGEVSGAVVDGHWSELRRRAGQVPIPPRTPFSELLDKLPAAPSEAGAKALSRALDRPTDTADTHPSLRDRLGALGCPAGQLRGKALAGPATTAAAELLPPGAAATFAARFDADWHKAVGERWREAHEEMQPLLAKLDRLETEAVGGPLAPEQAVERAGLTEDLHGGERALPRWRDVLALEPGNARANMAVGAHLLSEGDEAGLEHLERATASDPAAEPYAAQLAYAFEAARGRGEEAARHRSTVNAHLDVFDAAAEERRRLTKRDELEPHGLDPDALGELRDRLMRTDRVAGAYLARKRVQHLADDAPLYVLGLVPDTKWWRLEGGRDDQKMLERVMEEVALPGDFVAVSLASENKWLLKRLSKLGGAQVFAR